MGDRALSSTRLLLVLGVVAFGLAVLSVADMLLPRPYDGVVPRSDIDGRVVVAEVVPESGAHRAGLVSGDIILGIGRKILVGLRDAGRTLNAFRPGDTVIYLVKRPSGLDHIPVELGRRRIADGFYLYCCLLGFSFFFVGLFVLVRQPGLRASQIFFLLSLLFLLFLVCRMRPPSYSDVDILLLWVGTVAFLLLPPAFLHFYLLFPRPAWLDAEEHSPLGHELVRLWRRGWVAIYVLPPVVYWAHVAVAHQRGLEEPFFRGAPTASWFLLSIFLVLGLLALWSNWRRLTRPREQRGMALVLAGSFFALVPFLLSTVVFATARHNQAFFLFGILPLALVPITFAYAIVRFQLLDIRVILRRSLIYTVITASVSGLYAFGIAMFDALFSGTVVDRPEVLPVILALAIVLLFDPLRSRVQAVVNRNLFAQRSRLEREMVELGEAVAAQVDHEEVVRELVERLPKILGLHFAALYLLRGYRLERVAGPAELPKSLPILPELQRYLERRGRLSRLDELGALALRSAEVRMLVEELAGFEVEVLGNLATRRRHLGLVLLSTRRDQPIPLEREELDLLAQLMQQAAIALETGLLLAEHRQRAELEREIEIAATIQNSLFPDRLTLAEGWRVAARCRPARIVGGDFFSQLPTADADRLAVIYGDVCGKSVSAALVMMAAHEALGALALTETDPAALFTLANRRLYGLGQRNFVALGYFAPGVEEGVLDYLVAGQPPPLLRRASGEVEELVLPDHRVPVGALAAGRYDARRVHLAPGDLVLGYSDGVVEARAPGGELFGEERLVAIVGNAPADPEALIEAVLAALDDHSRGEIQYDDVTLVAVARSARGPGPESRSAFH